MFFKSIPSEPALVIKITLITLPSLLSSFVAAFISILLLFEKIAFEVIIEYVACFPLIKKGVILLLRL